jgi:diguanylate cyclase (GGDEF)-like protein/PAS domain S-box-containing protein
MSTFDPDGRPLRHPEPAPVPPISCLIPDFARLRLEDGPAAKADPQAARRAGEGESCAEAERYQRVFEKSKAVMLLIDPRDGRIVDANPAACTYYGYAREEMRRQRITDINQGDSDEVARDMQQAHDEARDHFHFRHRLADGTIRDVEVYSGPFTGKNGPLLFSIIHDITEQRRAETRQRLAASIFNHGHDGIVITDANERFLDVNQAFCDLTGYSREEVLGATPRILSSGRHGAEYYRAMWKALRIKGHWQGEIWNRRKNGEIYAERLTITAVRDSAGEIGHYVGVFSDITESKVKAKQLEEITYYDALTRLPNRKLLNDYFKVAQDHADHSERMLVLACLDLDGFKAINDTQGHRTGDELLMAVAKRLKKCLRAEDTVARRGGDEFVVLLRDLDTIEEGELALQRILDAVAQPFPLDGGSATLTASIGYTLYPADGGDLDTLLRHADQALYHAKELGRNRLHLFDREHGRRVQLHRDVRLQIEAALERSELELHYQPKVDMRAGKVLGAEALVRWNHPEQGMLPPGSFLPHIEHSDLIVQVGTWVLEEALRQMALWQKQGLVLPVSVNVAPRQLQTPDFCPRLAELIASYPELPPGSLQLEVLESTALDDVARIGEIIQECRALGVTVALDDFGTGYSTLTYLKRIPADQLKIDTSFVGDMLSDPEAEAIVEAVIGLAEAFKRTVIAEGAETPEHCAMLLRMGCDVAQGYGIAKPMPAQEIPDWVKRFQPHPHWQA